MNKANVFASQIAPNNEHVCIQIQSLPFKNIAYIYIIYIYICIHTWFRCIVHGTGTCFTVHQSREINRSKRPRHRLFMNFSGCTITPYRSPHHTLTYRCIAVWTVLEGSSDDLWEGLLVANDLVEDPEQGDPVAVVVTEETCEEWSAQGVFHSKGVLLIPQLEVGTCHRQGRGRSQRHDPTQSTSYICSYTKGLLVWIPVISQSTRGGTIGTSNRLPENHWWWVANQVLAVTIGYATGASTLTLTCGLTRKGVGAHCHLYDIGTHCTYVQTSTSNSTFVHTKPIGNMRNTRLNWCAHLPIGPRGLWENCCPARLMAWMTCGIHSPKPLKRSVRADWRRRMVCWCSDILWASEEACRLPRGVEWEETQSHSTYINTFTHIHIYVCSVHRKHSHTYMYIVHTCKYASTLQRLLHMPYTNSSDMHPPLLSPPPACLSHLLSAFCLLFSSRECSSWPRTSMWLVLRSFRALISVLSSSRSIWRRARSAVLVFCMSFCLQTQ